MEHYFNIMTKNVILQGITIRSQHTYIVYLHEETQSIHVNAFYQNGKKGGYRCCSHYDRWLCDTVEQYLSLTMQEIESQAYGAWMDGAR